MKALDIWIAEGKLMQFVAGQLDPQTYHEILGAAKLDPEVSAAIQQAKEALMGYLIGQAMLQDPNALIASGALHAYAEDLLDAQQRQEVEIMAMAHPTVSIAMDELKRKKVAAKIAAVRALDPNALIASPMLMDYVLGECSAADALEVEMAAAYFPSVAAELGDLLQISEALILQGAVAPPVASKHRFSDFISTNAVPADGWNIVMPALSSVSRAVDFDAWINRINPDAIVPENNLNVFPLDAAPHALTLFVVVKEQLEEEVHLDSIERFLVLEGACVIELEDEKIHLKAGDYYSVPKFTPHTVVVTSDIPCKLIVQQVAA